jgi:hypothetical protein
MSSKSILKEKFAFSGTHPTKSSLKGTKFENDVLKQSC